MNDIIANLGITSLQTFKIIEPWEIYFENIGYWDFLSLDLGIYIISIRQPWPCSTPQGNKQPHSRPQ